MRKTLRRWERSRWRQASEDETGLNELTAGLPHCTCDRFSFIYYLNGFNSKSCPRLQHLLHLDDTITRKSDNKHIGLYSLVLNFLLSRELSGCLSSSQLLCLCFCFAPLWNWFVMFRNTLCLEGNNWKYSFCVFNSLLFLYFLFPTVNKPGQTQTFCNGFEWWQLQLRQQLLPRNSKILQWCIDQS